MARAAAIVLAGGRSSRMGSPKAALEWHGSTLLRRVTGLVARAVDGPVVVVGAPAQGLPPLAPSVAVVSDEREGRGPLQGLAAGLEAVAGEVEVAYVSSTDVPLLHPAFVAYVVSALGDEFDVALPEVGGHRQPLAAAYRVELLDTVNDLIASDLMRPAHLFDRCRVTTLDERALGEVHPVESVTNINERADYERVRALPGPEIQVERFGPLAPKDRPRREHVRAWSLGELAREIGLELDDHVVAALNGDRITRDPEVPLVAGDAVAFMVADAGG
jgi:molybdopterin-guanine dinucleotide biosynthesis protein A